MQTTKQAKSKNNVDFIQTCLQNTEDTPQAINERNTAIDLLCNLQPHEIDGLTDAFLQLVFDTTKIETGSNLSRLLKFLSKIRKQNLNSVIRSFLEDAEFADQATVNHAILFEGMVVFKNNELEILNKFKIDGNTLSVFRAHRNKMSICAIEKLYQKLLSAAKTEYFYRLFYEINFVLKNDVIDEFELEWSFEDYYLRFLCSLMIGDKSMARVAELVEKNRLYDQLQNAIYMFSSLSREYEASIQPKDVDRMEAIFLILNRFLTASFYADPTKKFRLLSERLLENISFKLPSPVKKQIYMFFCNLSLSGSLNLSGFLSDPEFYRRAYKDFESERYINDYTCTTELLRLAISISHVSPSLVDFCNHVLSCEDPDVSICVLKIFVFNGHKITQGNIAKYLKEAAFKNNDVVLHIIDYCLKTNHLIPNIELTRTIVLIGAENFFEFISLFDDFSVYLNSDFLARIDSDRTKGLNFLKNTNEEICRFVLNNFKYFNNVAKNEKDVVRLKLLLEIYCGLVEYDDSVEFSFSDDSLIIIPRVYCAPFFKLLSNRLSYFYFSSGNFQSYLCRDYLVDEDSLEECCNYLKTALMVGSDFDISNITNNFIGNCVDDLVGFYRCCGNKVNFSAISIRNKILEGTKNNDFFIKNYESVGQLEKYLFFSVVDTTELSKNSLQKRAFEQIIRKEFLRFKLEGFSQENILIARHCFLYLLFLDNFDSIVRLIDEIDLPENFNDLVVAVNIRNLCNGGTSYIKQYCKGGSIELQAKFMLLAYLCGLWTGEFQLWAMEMRRVCKSNADLNDLFSIIN